MIGIWAGVAVLVGLTVSLTVGLAGWPLVLGLGVLASLALRGTVPNAIARSVVVAVLVGLAGLGIVWAESVAPVPSLVGIGETERVEGRVVSPVQTDLRYQHVEVELTRVRSGSLWLDATGRVRIVAPSSPRLAYGDLVGLTGELVPAEDSEAGYRSYLEQQRVAGTVFARTVWVEQPGSGVRRSLFAFGADLAERLRRAVPGDSGVLLGGLVVGDDSALSDEMAASFRETGMSHITAVSGANLALVVVLLMAVAQPVRLQRRLVWLLGVTVAIWLYAAVTGLEPPVVRAALMATIALLAIPFGRRPDYLTAAVLSAAVMALYDPGLIRDIGFQLSLSASVALAAVAAGVAIRSPGGAMQVAVNGSIIAQIATLPITVVAFGSVSLVAIPLNLIVGPLVGIVFPVAFIGALLGSVSPVASEAVIAVAGGLGDLILLIIDGFGRLPFASVAIPGLTMPGKVALLVVSVVVVVLVSKDGQRWLGRLARPSGAAGATPKGDPLR